ncbi:MAG: hypothetical protein LBJ37_16230 [Paucimonas sp.]|jgi:ABC-type transporter Mla subunit MlaD|nr:hypothetical protein [Paucimonas sp.]
MADRFLAFRCFGNFAWPPLEGVKPDPESVLGVVEIFYVLDDKAKKMVGCARWVPKEAWTAELAFNTALRDIPPLPADLEAARKALGNGGNTIHACRFDNPGVALVFEGVQVFEQYEVLRNGAAGFAHKLDLRVPVVRQHFPNGKGGEYTSRVLIGSKHQSLLRFDLALPLLSPQDDEQFKEKRAFVAFSASYEASQAASMFTANAQPLLVKTMGFGRQDRTIWDDGKNAVRFNSLKPPAIKAIGRFGLAWDIWPKTRNEESWVELREANYWPSKKSILGHLLPALGLRVQADMKSFDVRYEEGDVSLFQPMPGIAVRAADDEGRRSFRIEQRFALNATTEVSGDAELSDIRVKANKIIQLRAAGMDGAWLSFANQLHITVVISGTVTDVWSDKHDTLVQVSIGGTEILEKVSGAFEPLNQGTGFLALLNAAIPSMAQARLALHQLAPDQPQSSLPEFQVAVPTGDKPVHFGLFAGRHEGSLSAGKLVLDRDSWLWSARLGNHEDASIFNDPERARKETRIPLQVSWPSLHRQPRLTSCYLVHEAEDSQDVFRGVRLKLTQADQSIQKTALVTQLGGLELTYSTSEFINSASIQLRLRSDPGVIDTPASVGIKVKLDLVVTQVEPIAVDVLRGDRSGRAQPLLYRETGGQAGKGQYSLKLTEEVRDDRQWRLVASLKEDVQNTAGDHKSLLIGEQPFIFQRFYSTPLDMLGGQATGFIASYDSDERGWKFRQTNGRYHYVLPPQVIGESMDKPRRLELQDAEVKKEYGANEFVRPIDVTWEGKPAQTHRRAVEFRLTPAAHLWVQPSDVERNYVLPEWAAGDLFRQRGELGLGCALDSLSGEFVYGLSFGVTPKLEQGTARRTRVAEIEALTGRPVPPDEGRKEERWNRLHQAMLTRPQRLELWADDPSQRMQFAPVRFSDGARFALRSTALHRPAVAALEVRAEEGKEPGLPTQEVPGLSPRLHPAGLSGGALWPIESANVLRMVLAQPRASGGSIENIALSPLGGDADQTVKFNNNRVSIISETRGGFVQRQKVEVLGRIGAFWHRAKHVVVYERTVNPSAQFTPEGGLGTRTRRPVLRKVSEYIEILEPERHYPDMPTAPVHTSCFLRSLRFNKRIIPVDSFWAEDIGTVGWSIPLWNRHAARQRPQVYGMPDVAFVTSAEGDGDDPLVAQGCLDPDNLYFFADTSLEQTDDTNAWGVRRDIDYTDLPPPKHTKDSATTATVPPGFARFTWRLAPAAQRTRVNAGRADKPVYVGLETLTFMRAGRQDSPKKPDVDSALNLVDTLPAALVKTERPTPLFEGFLGKGTVVPGPLEALTSGLANVIALPATLPVNADEIAEVKARLEALGEAQRSKLIAKAGIQEHAEALAKSCKSVVEPLKAQLDDLDKRITTLPASCEALQKNLGSSITARRMAMVQELDAWRQDTIRSLPTPLPVQFNDPKDFYPYLSGQLHKLLLPLFESTSAELGKLRRGIEITRLTADGAVAAAHDVIARARAELDAMEKLVDRTKPWSASRVQDLQQQIEHALARMSQAVAGQVRSARQRLSVEIDDLTQRIGKVAAWAIEQALKGATQLQLLDQVLATMDKSLPGEAAVKDYLSKVEAVLKKIDKPERSEVIKKIRSTLESMGDALIKARVQFDKGAASGQRLLEQLGQLAALLKTTHDSLEENTEALGAYLKTEIADLEEELLQAFNASLASLSVPVTDEIEKLLDVLHKPKEGADYLFEQARAALGAAEKWLEQQSAPLHEALDEVIDDTLGKVKTVEDMLAGDKVVEQLVKSLCNLPALRLAVERVGTVVFETGQAVEKRRQAVIDLVNACTDELISGLDAGATLLSGLNDEIGKTCRVVSGGLGGLRDQLKRDADAVLKPLNDRLDKYQKEVLDELDTWLGDAQRYKELLLELESFEQDVRNVCNDLATTRNLVEGYGERVIDAVGRLGEGGLLAAPNNILRAMAAFGSTPDLPNLDFSRLTSPYFFGWAEDRVDMAPIQAWFGRLGDDLKALGLDMDIDGVTDRLIPADLLQKDIGKILQNVAALDLRKLLPGYKLSAAAKDAIRVTHEFDKKNLRAWVQVDVDLPLPERRSLFSVGPVTLDLMNARITAVVRLEASKDSAEVAQTGTATLLTDFDAVVAGTSMVTLSQVAVRFDRNSGLKVDFDPRKIRLNPSFQFIQNTFQSIFGDEIGGLKIIKDNGIPIGVEHLFALPPMGMMFGTSGVQNIQISNAFRLLAYPDFLISNSFALARADLPFLFSVFIVGGSGWLTVDLNYRPFNNELAVVVDAAAGGSGSLGFSFCGVSGTVAISLNVALTYRKLIGRPGGGLTVSMVVVITGVVDVLRIASAYLSVTLRLSYQDNGDIDATGSFRVSIRISRFFTVKAGGQARYRMTGGRREVSSSTNSDVRAESLKKAKKLIDGQGRA